jgi:hypothetical protein
LDKGAERKKGIAMEKADFYSESLPKVLSPAFKPSEASRRSRTSRQKAAPRWGGF